MAFVLSFDGSSNQARTASEDAGVQGATTTIAVKIRLNKAAFPSAGTVTLLEVSDGASTRKLLLDLYNASTTQFGLLIYASNWGSINGTLDKSAIAAGEYVVVYAHSDPSGGRFMGVYKEDGTLLGSASQATGPATLPAVGHVAIAAKYDGTADLPSGAGIDGVALYSSTLAGADRYSAPAAADSGIVALWAFDEGSGTSAANAAGTEPLTLAGHSWVEGGTWDAAAAANTEPSISIDQSSPQAAPMGAELALSATATDAEDADLSGSIAWSSDDERVATVDSGTGVVTPVAPGTATITATVTDSGGLQASDTVGVTVSATGSPFAATDYPGLVGWYDPSQLAGSDGDSVVTVPDQSGNSRDLAASGTAPTLETNEFHALPCLRFSAANSRLASSDVGFDTTRATVFVVAYSEGAIPPSADEYLFSKSASNPDALAVLREGSASGGQWLGGMRTAATPGTLQSLESDWWARPGWLVHELVYDGATFTYRVNGNLIATSAVAGDIDTVSGGAFTLGNHPTTDAAWGGMIGDAVFYGQALTAAERNAIAYDLALKWSEGRIAAADPANPIFTAAECGIDDIVELKPARLYLDGSTWYLFFCMRDAAGWVGASYATSPAADPWNFTPSGVQMIPATANCGGISAVRSGGTWYAYVEDRDAGTISLYTGATLDALTNQGVVISGSGVENAHDQYVRMPSTPLFDSDTSTWYMLVDGRAQFATSGIGSIYLYSSSDLSTWTQVALVLAPSAAEDWEKHDVGGPDWVKVGSTFWMVYTGYNVQMGHTEQDYPHHIGLASSTDRLNWTRHEQNPIAWTIPGSWFEASLEAPTIADIGGRLQVMVSGRPASPGGDFGRWETTIATTAVPTDPPTVTEPWNFWRERALRRLNRPWRGRP